MISARLVPPLNPASSKWYFLAWSVSELGTGVTITSSDWGYLDDGAFVSALPTGLQSDAVYHSGLTTGVRLSVTTAAEGDSFQVINQIATSSGETLHETIPLTISSEGH